MNYLAFIVPDEGPSRNDPCALHFASLNEDITCRQILVVMIPSDMRIEIQLPSDYCHYVEIHLSILLWIDSLVIHLDTPLFVWFNWRIHKFALHFFVRRREKIRLCHYFLLYMTSISIFLNLYSNITFFSTWNHFNYYNFIIIIYKVW